MKQTRLGFRSKLRLAIVLATCAHEAWASDWMTNSTASSAGRFPSKFQWMRASTPRFIAAHAACCWGPGACFRTVSTDKRPVMRLMSRMETSFGTTESQTAIDAEVQTGWNNAPHIRLRQIASRQLRTRHICSVWGCGQQDRITVPPRVLSNDRAFQGENGTSARSRIPVRGAQQQSTDRAETVALLRRLSRLGSLSDGAPRKPPLATLAAEAIGTVEALPRTLVTRRYCSLSQMRRASSKPSETRGVKCYRPFVASRTLASGKGELQADDGRGTSRCRSSERPNVCFQVKAEFASTSAMGAQSCR